MTWAKLFWDIAGAVVGLVLTVAGAVLALWVLALFLSAVSGLVMGWLSRV